MTLFESLSIVLYGAQLGAIIRGIGWMKTSSDSRAEQTAILNKSLERQGKALEDIGVGIREQSAALAKMGAGIERLLTRSE